jgi:hypothetical protein
VSLKVNSRLRFVRIILYESHLKFATLLLAKRGRQVVEVEPKKTIAIKTEVLMAKYEFENQNIHNTFYIGFL